MVSEGGGSEEEGRGSVEGNGKMLQLLMLWKGSHDVIDMRF